MRVSWEKENHATVCLMCCARRKSDLHQDFIPPTDRKTVRVFVLFCYFILFRLSHTRTHTHTHARGQFIGYRHGNHLQDTHTHILSHASLPEAASCLQQQQVDDLLRTLSSLCVPLTLTPSLFFLRLTCSSIPAASQNSNSLMSGDDICILMHLIIFMWYIVN